MTPIVLKRLSEKASLPCGNPFVVIPVSINCVTSDNYIVSTGLEFMVPRGFRMDIISQTDGIFILGWSMCFELKILVFAPSPWARKLADGGIFARVVLSSSEVAAVRFLESTDDGIHVVKGDGAG